MARKHGGMRYLAAVEALEDLTGTAATVADVAEVVQVTDQAAYTNLRRLLAKGLLERERLIRRGRPAVGAYRVTSTGVDVLDMPRH